MAITDTSTRSTWINAVGYRRTNDLTVLAIFTSHKDTPVAILYGDVPSHLPGLLVSGRVTAKDDGELSIGAAYSRLVKGRYHPSQTIEGAKSVAELKEMMMS